MAILKNIFRYPIKGLSGDGMPEVKLAAGKPVPCDRQYAIALSDTEFDAENPVHLSKTKFVMLMRDTKLAEINTEFVEDGHRLVVRSKAGDVLLDVKLQDADDNEKLGSFFLEFIGKPLKAAPRVVTSEGHMFADVPQQNLSLINIDSVRDIEEKTGLKIDPKRFRGNLYVEGIGAWKEFELVDQTFTIGDVTFKAVGRIDRCAAVNVNLDTAERDMNIPLQIRKNYGHLDCGVYLDVVKGGVLKEGDTISLP